MRHLRTLSMLSSKSRSCRRCIPHHRDYLQSSLPKLDSNLHCLRSLPSLLPEPPLYPKKSLHRIKPSGSLNQANLCFTTHRASAPEPPSPIRAPVLELASSPPQTLLEPEHNLKPQPEIQSSIFLLLLRYHRPGYLPV